MPSFPSGSKSFQTRNPHLFTPSTPSKPAKLVSDNAIPGTLIDRPHQDSGQNGLKANAVIKPSTDEAKLNKTEALFLSHLKTQGQPWVGVQNITLKLGHDCRYTPDFTVLTVWAEIWFYDTKGGFVRDDSMVKIRVAARAFPWARFWIAQRLKDRWEYREIHP